jgi:hypothetical protein
MEDKWIKVAAGAFLICVLLFMIVYLKPRQRKEGFSTVNLGVDFPKCVTRSADAQALLQQLKPSVAGLPPAADASMAYAELSLILQKLLCMDADITSLGAGIYSTMGLPFSTQHDMEPVGSFVGRCLKNAVQSRDIELTIGKLNTRGVELIGDLCQDESERQTAYNRFHTVVTQVTKAITPVCLAKHATMDIPPGVRDPGYYKPPTLQQWSEYKEMGTD